MECGKLRSLEQYQALFPGFEADIAQEFALLEDASALNLDSADPVEPAMAASTEEHIAPLERIGPYRILETLGEGGMGTVYLAEQREPVRRRVALKVIKLGMDSKQVLARFEAERQALAMMNHDNIARVFEAGTTERGQPYFVMEHVEGIPITDYCDQHKLTLEQRIELFQRACAGVQHAHQKGVIHRDLKPSNVLVTRREEKAIPKIIDFGLARATDHQLIEQTLFTEQGQILGTPEYMSPEQAGFDAQGIDTRTDIYSLGVMLYELLAGELPFSARELRQAGIMELQRKIREDQPPKPSTRISTLGDAASERAEGRQTSLHTWGKALRGDLDWIVLKAMAKEPERRYESATGIALDLGRHLSHEPVLAGPPSAAYRVQKFVRRYRVQVTAAALVLVTLIGGGIGTLWFAVRAAELARVADHRATENERLAKEAQEAAREAKQARDAERLGREKADAARRVASAKANLLKAEREDASAHKMTALAHAVGSFRLDASARSADLAWHLRNQTQRAVWVSPRMAPHTGPVRSVAFNSDGTRIVSGSTDKTVRVWNAATGEMLRTLHGHDDTVTSVAFNATSTRIVSGSADRTVRVWDAENGHQLQQLEHAEGVWSVACSDTHIVSGGQNLETLHLWDADTGRQLREFEHPGGALSVAFNADGTRIASGGLNGETLRLWDAVSGTQLRSFEDAGHVCSVAFSRDGSRIVASSDKAVSVWDVETGKLLRELEGHTQVVWSVAFSPDGSRIVAGSSDKTARVWDADTGRLLRKLEGHTDVVDSVAFSSDGMHVATGSRDATMRVWDLVSGKQLREPVGHTNRVYSAAFSPDGKRIVSSSADNTVRLWEAATGRQERVLAGHTSGVLCVAFNRDGSCVVSGSSDKSVRLWNAGTGELLREFPGHTGGVSSVAFGPDDTRIVSGSEDKTARVWNVETGELLQTLSHKHAVTSVAYSPDGTRIVSNPAGNTVWLWDAETGEQQRVLEGHDSRVSCVAFNPDGTRIASGSWDQSVRVWDATTGAQLLELRGHSDGVDSVAFSADGARIVSGSGDSSVRVWDSEAGKLLFELEGHTDRVWSVAFSPDGTRVVSGGWDDTVRLWSAERVERVCLPQGHVRGVRSVTYSPDGARVASGAEDNTIRLWDAETGKLLQTRTRHAGIVHSVAYHPDGTRIVSGSEDGTLRVWDTGTGRHLHTFEVHSPVSSVAYSRDGARTVSGSADGIVRLWDMQSAERIRNLEGHTAGVVSVAFSPDGTSIASGARDGTVRVWNVQTGRLMHELENSGVQFEVVSVAFSPDGAQIASSGGACLKPMPSMPNHCGTTVRVWSTESGELLHELEGHEWAPDRDVVGGVRSVAYSPDSTRIVSGSWDNTVRLWDARAGKRLPKRSSPLAVLLFGENEEQVMFGGHTSGVNAVAFSPDGGSVVSGSEDKTVRISDAEDGKPVRVLEGHTSWIVSVASGPDGGQLATADASGSVLLWDSISGDLEKGVSPEEARQRHDQWKQDSLLTTPTPGHVIVKGEGIVRAAFAKQAVHRRAAGPGILPELDSIITRWERDVGARVDLDTGTLVRIPCPGSAYVGTRCAEFCR